jgi:ABC-type Na+ efflux pump permease subunit
MTPPMSPLAIASVPKTATGACNIAATSANREPANIPFTTPTIMFIDKLMDSIILIQSFQLLRLLRFLSLTFTGDTTANTL